MTCKRLPIVVSLLLGCAALRSVSQTTQALPRSTPEAEGVPSSAISRWLDAAAVSKDEFHSFMLLRHGKVIAEGWWNPYRADLKHTLYSVSKSFTSSAVGFAVSEGRMSVHDKVVSFFPHDLPDTISPFLSELTVKDLLDMSEGQDPEPTARVVTVDSNWVRAYLAIPVVHRPGTQFLYNSLGVYILAAIVEKVTGQKLVDYLTPRLFQPLGIQGADWEVSPQGIATGGWGLRLKTEDLAKMGELYLRKGRWNGKQLLPAKWIDEATSVSIMQTPDPASKTPVDSSDWLQGYGYLFWHCRQKNVYRADGAFGQYIIVMPDQDAVLAITSETSDMQDELNLVWRYLFPAMRTDPSSASADLRSAGKKDELPADPKAQALLQKKIAALALPLFPAQASLSAQGTGRNVPAGADMPVAALISGKTFSIAPNETRITALSFSFAGKLCRLTITEDGIVYPLAFTAGKWEKGMTTLHGPHLTSKARANLTGLPPFQIAGTWRWSGENKLELVLRFIESPHTQRITCLFDAGKMSAATKMSATIQNSLDFGKKSTVLDGALQP
jgi:CubicO group peptidase (beta-lactamase class C family)